MLRILPNRPALPILLWLRSTAHAVSFAMRQGLSWSRGLPTLQGGAWTQAMRHWSPDYTSERRHAMQARATELVQTYGLEAYTGKLHGRQWAKNLYLLDLLVHTIGPCLLAKPMPPYCAVDVGCADWDYVFALHAFLRGPVFLAGGPLESGPVTAPPHCGLDQLTGIEIDPHGIYPDGYSRADYTRAYVQALAKSQNENATKIIHGDALQVQLPQQDLVFCFFPFLLPYQIVAWGLPLGLLHPEAMIQKQASWVKPGGLWVIYTHAEEEREPLRNLLSPWVDGKSAPFTLLRAEAARSLLEERPDDYDERWVWVLQRKT